MQNQSKHIDSIINDCKRDDPKAQEQLYSYFYHAMMNLCLRYTKCEEDAKLILNTGFLKVFQNIKNYNPAKAALYTWVRMIFVSSCLDYIKSKRSRIDTNELTESESIQIEPEVILKMNAEQILQLVRKLPAATQAVFNLYIMEGYDHREIAGLLRISEGTSRWHLSEARRMLKLQLEEEKI